MDQQNNKLHEEISSHSELLDVGKVSSYDWKPFSLTAITITIVIVLGVHQNIGWVKLAEFMSTSSKIKRDTDIQNLIQQILLNDKIQEYIKTQSSSAENAFNISALILSTVSIFLVLVALLLFREYDRLKQYQDTFEKMINIYKLQSKKEIDDAKKANEQNIKFNDAKLLKHIADIEAQFTELDKKVKSNQILLDSVPALESAEFEAILTLSDDLLSSELINMNLYNNLLIVYYSNMLSPFTGRLHERALLQILNLLPEIKTSTILGQTLDLKLQKLIQSSNDSNIINLCFKVQRTLISKHPY